jgi:hypothetical protein
MDGLGVGSGCGDEIIDIHGGWSIKLRGRKNG